MANQDTELTLSTGKLLGIFFGMVAICAVFFSLGYAVGKGAGSANAQTVTDSADLSSISSTGGAKPAAGKAAPPPESTTPAETTTVPAADASSAAPAETAAKSDSTPADSAATKAPELADTARTGFMVQVAAVSKKEDAEALVSALRKKQYPVIIVNNVPNSPLFHVQVGPFSQQKEAEAMRNKLAGDGYNAILKK